MSAQIKAWKEVTFPHEDVRTGTLKMSKFAADLTSVSQGNAAPEYQDAAKFFERTYITEGMQDLLVSVAKRLSGKGGDPVIQLKTNFGGGKTHSMLAVYHLATSKYPTKKLKGVSAILDAADIDGLPQANIAVLVGTCISANEPAKMEGKTIRTLWGHLAFQLLGIEGFEMVEQSDVAGTAPGTDVLVELLKRAAPCVILCDELVAFMGQLVSPSETPAAGTFRANMTLIQNLTQAMNAVPNAMLLASLPQSEEELGGVDGEKALIQLESVFTRIEAIWKPVATEESFEIVRRRLFADIGSEKDRDDACKAYAEMYKANPELFPPEVQEATYLDRMRKTYPLHPEIFDRLYADWSTLQKFQKTRGVLQYMAIVINRLWEANNKDPMIMPGSLPLSDVEVEKKSTQYLQRTGWSAVIQSEIDGKTSIAGRLDAERPNFGTDLYAERTARTIFLGSAPSAEALQQNTTRGLEQKRIVLGAAIPGQQLGVYEDVLDALRDQSRYLSNERTRFYYDTRPNLRREMEERKLHVNDVAAEDYLRGIVQHVCGNGSYFSGVHVFVPHSDIDDYIGRGPKLVVVKPDMTTAYARTNEKRAFEEATAYLTKRGGSPRTKQNRLVFLFPDQNNVNRLLDQVRTCLAWKDIVEASDRGNLILDTAQLANAQTYVKRAENAVEVSVRECYRFALIPESPDKRNVGYVVERVGTQSGYIASTIENFMLDSGLLVKAWSPIFLKKLLDDYYLKGDAEEESLKKVWENTCAYLYMERLCNEDVFLRAFIDGVKERSFGFARGKDGDEYLGFAYGEEILAAQIDAGMLVLSKKKAEELDAKRRCPQCGSYPCKCASGSGQGAEGSGSVGGSASGAEGTNSTGGSIGGSATGADAKKRFWGSIRLDPLSATLKFADVMEYVANLLNSKPGVTAEIKVDIEARSAEPFDHKTISDVTQNCNDLGFSQHGFEAE